MARTAVVAATNRPAETYIWFENINRKSFKELGKSDGFDTLDWKLKTAVNKIAHGDLSARMFEREEEMTMQGQMYRGRQMMKDVLRWHTSEDVESLMHDLEDLQKVQLNGLALRKFLIMWNYVWRGMQHHPDAITKRSIFFTQVQKFTPLEEEWKRFKKRSELIRELLNL